MERPRWDLTHTRSRNMTVSVPRSYTVAIYTDTKEHYLEIRWTTIITSFYSSILMFFFRYLVDRFNKALYTYYRPTMGIGIVSAY